jgi:hypothetical protein
MRAKFNVSKVTKEYYGEEVSLHAVYANDRNEEDNQFSTATPSGQLMMVVSNPNAIGFFQEGKSYYLDFTEAPTPY